MVGKIERYTRNLAFSGSLLLHLLAVVQYYLLRSESAAGPQYVWQFMVLTGISMLLSLHLRGRRGGFLPAGILKAALLYFIGYPLGGYIGAELSLFLALVFEAGLLMSPMGASLFTLAELAFLLVSQRQVSAFFLNLPPPGPHDLLSLGAYGLFGIGITLLLSLFLCRLETAEDQRRRLDAAVRQLTRANLGFQSYASHLELDTLDAERKRISREIHDTVGYSLTNILMTLEAAGDLVEDDPVRARRLLGGSIDEARRCLEETRASRRELRSSELREPAGLAAIARLTESFARATGVAVTVEYGNAAPGYGLRIDAVILRMLQEAMTNAFRHGMATDIRIHLRQAGGRLHLRIQDNGSGADEPEEGIGLAGMRERLDAVCGTLTAGNGAGGFRIDAEIPVEGRSE